MLFTLRWEPVKEVVVLTKLCYKRRPHSGGGPAGREAIGIAYENESISGSREEDVETLCTSHESDVTTLVGTRQAHDDNLALFSLKVICDSLASPIVTIVSQCTNQLSTL
jgi:hypothetical protein